MGAIGGLVIGVASMAWLTTQSEPPAVTLSDPAATTDASPGPKPRYDFFTVLPNQDLDLASDVEPAGLSENAADGDLYLLQAGSFRLQKDADRRRGELALLGLTAAIEIVDSRIRDWKITIADTVADLASNGAIALSSRVIPLDSVDPRLIGMVFTKNGDVVATGAGAAALGDPLAAVAWLANTLAPFGAHLPAGSVIMTGALHAMVPIQAGDTFRAEFDHLGPIALKVVGEEE